VLNDRITFSHLPGHARSWGARCLRFHSTSAAGTIATLVMSFAFKTWLGMTALIAEAVAILLALVLNFTMHHLWTYRHLKDDDSHSGQPGEALALAAHEAQGRAG
jgi:putative flippase GtrA